MLKSKFFGDFALSDKHGGIRMFGFLAPSSNNSEFLNRQLQIIHLTSLVFIICHDESY